MITQSKLLDKETGGAFGNAETMTAPEFQKAAGKTLTTIAEQNEALVKNYDQLDKATKKSFEDFTTTIQKQSQDLVSLELSLKRVNLALANERRMAFANPLERIARDPEKRNLFVAMLLKSLGSDVIERCGPKIQALMKSLHPLREAEDGFGCRRDLDTATTTGASYIDTNEVERDIYDVLALYGAYRTVDFRMVGAKAVEIPIKTARPLVTFVDEAAAIDVDATKAGARVTITPKKLGALLSVTTELLEDDVVGVVNDVLNDLAESMAFKWDWITFTADGTADATDGGFTGMFYGGTAVTAATGNTTTATMELDDFIATVANAPSGIVTRPCRWWIHPTLLVKSLKIRDGNGRPMFQTALEAPSAGAIGSILGSPVTQVHAAPSTDAAGAYIAAFGDPNAMALRVRRDLRIDRSEHYAFNTDELVFRATSRVGAKIKIATGIQVLKSAAS